MEISETNVSTMSIYRQECRKDTTLFMYVAYCGNKEWRDGKGNETNLHETHLSRYTLIGQLRLLLVPKPKYSHEQTTLHSPQKQHPFQNYQKTRS